MPTLVNLIHQVQWKLSSFFRPATPQKCVCYFVRHGQTVDNADGRWGAGDPSLNDQGKQEADLIANDLAGILFDKAFASKSLRTKETAEIILKNRTINLKRKNKFSEMKIGPFEGKLTSEIIEYFCQATGYPDPLTKQTLPKLWAKLNGEPIKEANDCLLDPWGFENTDTFDGFYQKCLEKIKRTAKKNLGKTLLIATHSTVIKTVVAAALKLPIEKIKNKTGSWVGVEIDQEGTISLIPNQMKGISF